MKRYLKLFISLLNFSSKQYLEHRWHAAGYMFSSAATLAVLLFLVQIIFFLTKDINGWQKEEIFFFLGVFKVFSSLFSFLFLGAINDVPSLVHKGELDLLLTRPISTQFYLSFRRFRVYEFFNILPGVALIIYANKFIGNTSTNWFYLILGLLAGLMILYSIYFAFATLSFWLVRFSSLSNMYVLLTQPLNFPIDIFGRGFAFVLTFIIPLGFIVSVPVEIFFGKVSFLYLGMGWFFASLTFLFSIWFWKFALKYYTSASS